eukprot:6885175-Pyramimonas_sp.AAC.1
MEWSGVEWSGVELGRDVAERILLPRSRVTGEAARTPQHIGVERRREEWSGAELEWSGEGRSGVEWRGVERSREEWTGAEGSVAERSGGEWSGA